MVSVIIPVFHEEKVLPETLQALLVQPGDYEVIVVDGGSTDCTTQVLRKFGFADHRSLLPSHPTRCGSRYRKGAPRR